MDDGRLEAVQISDAASSVEGKLANRAPLERCRAVREHLPAQGPRIRRTREWERGAEKRVILRRFCHFMLLDCSGAPPSVSTAQWSTPKILPILLGRPSTPTATRPGTPSERVSMALRSFQSPTGMIQKPYTRFNVRSECSSSATSGSVFPLSAARSGETQPCMKWAPEAGTGPPGHCRAACTRARGRAG